MTETIKIDKFGKIFIPKRIRDKLGAEDFEILIKNNEVNLIPVKNPLVLFGTLKKFNNKILDDIHGEEHEFDA